jgi:GxxExxY protein
MGTNIIYKEESYRIMGACFEVYKEKGCGFLEAVYQECLELEFGLQGILFQPRVELALAYKGRPLKQRYVPDFVCFGTAILILTDGAPTCSRLNPLAQQKTPVFVGVQSRLQVGAPSK